MRRDISMKNSVLSLTVILITVLLIFVSGCNEILSPSAGISGDPESSLSSYPTNTPEPTPIPTPDLRAEAVIMATGDIILHETVINGGSKQDGSYNYDHIFAFVKDIFAQADLVTVNFEGTTAGPGYSGYPRFNAPDEIAKAIFDAGADMVTTANNHAYDKGIEGVRRTADVFKQAGLLVVGTRSKADDPVFEIADLNGIKVGFTGYTYETGGDENTRAINGLPMTEEAWPLVDSFNYYNAARLDKDKLAMAERISLMRQAGAELIVFQMHWGDEYQKSSNGRQQDLAKFLAENGVDVIFGHHPHVLQEIDVITSEDGKRNTVVFYSIGNIMGNMAFGTHSTQGYAEDAVIAKVLVKRDSEGNISITEGRYLKTYIWKDDTSGRRIHKILPVKAAIADPAAFGAGEYVLELVRASDKRIDNVLLPSVKTEGPVVIGEFGDIS